LIVSSSPEGAETFIISYAIKKKSSDRTELGGGSSIFRQFVGGLVFLEACLAAKIEFLLPVGEGEGLAFGNIASADGVLNHLLAYFLGSGRSPVLGEKGPFDYPVNNPH
jgi:hypothetical protein